VNHLQLLVDGFNAQASAERANDPNGLTLGRWIALLENLPPLAPVAGLGEPMSYRGYYSDLALDAADERRVDAAVLLIEARGAMGAVFGGYKGGNFPMHANSPVWVSEYGSASGWRLAGLREVVGVWVPVVAPEDEYARVIVDPYVKALTEAT